MSSIYLVLSTVDDEQEAARLANVLVEERLAACVNIVPGLTSIYRWEGEVQREQEYLMVVKTSEDRLEELEFRLADLHPYDTPEIVSIPVVSGNEAYLEWVREETQ